ncbi:hypothetical protein [Ensifer aridi]|uniref:hypothetical protein n=1 Tax=Ensifer aridi TaxID=1708715 RepID=UPI0004192DDA|nr:hypothetical protein [Ensifer aridi]
MSDDNNDFVENAVKYALAKAQMAAASSYLSRGRQLRNLSNQDLEAHWVNSFKSWINSSGPQGRQASEDAEAEMAMRGMEPPLHLVKEEFDALTERAKRSAELPDAVDNIGGSIIDEYVKAKRSEN